MSKALILLALVATVHAVRLDSTTKEDIDDEMNPLSLEDEDPKNLTRAELRVVYRQKQRQLAHKDEELKKLQLRLGKVEDKIDQNVGFKSGRKLVNAFALVGRSMGNLESFITDACKGAKGCSVNNKKFKAAYMAKYQPHEQELLRVTQEKMHIPCDQRGGTMLAAQLEKLRHVVDKQVDYIFGLLDDNSDGVVKEAEHAETCKLLLKDPTALMPDSYALKVPYENLLFSCSPCSAGAKDVFTTDNFQKLAQYKANSYNCGAEATKTVEPEVEVTNSCDNQEALKRYQNRRATTTSTAKGELSSMAQGILNGLEKGAANLDTTLADEGFEE